MSWAEIGTGDVSVKDVEGHFTHFVRAIGHDGELGDRWQLNAIERCGEPEHVIGIYLEPEGV